jgi:hypothetical protein
MMQKTVSFLKKTFQGINTPVMILALLLSLGLWYINKLGHRYTVDVTLPVHIVNSADSPIGVLQQEHRIECRIEGAGYRLLAYTLFPDRQTVSIDLRRLDVLPAGADGLSEITLSSLSNAIDGQLGDVRLVSIDLPRFEVAASPLRSKMLPVRSRVRLELRNPYMQIGPVRLYPDSLEVKTLEIVLDTLQAVYTEARSFDDLATPLSGRIGLVSPPGVLLPLAEVGYRVAVEEYTEVDLSLPLTLHNAPPERTAVILPEEISVRLNVSRSRYASVSSGAIAAFIDYKERTTNLGSAYRVHLPVGEGIEVKEIVPLYVELVFQQEP